MIHPLSKCWRFVKISFLSKERYNPTKNRFTIEDGPHGGLGGIPFTDGDGINRNGYITALEIRSHSEIDAIRARYGDTWGEWHGGTGGEFYEVTLNEGAYIYLVQGTLNNF